MKQITEIQQKRLQSKLELLKPEIEKASKELKHALGFGDRSENSEADAAEQKLRLLEAEIADIENTLQYSEVVKVSDSNRIVIGSLISVMQLDVPEEKERLFMFDTNGDTIISGVLNIDSPLGKKINGNPSGVYTIQAESGQELRFRVNRESIDRLPEYDKEFPDEKTFFSNQFKFE